MDSVTNYKNNFGWLYIITAVVSLEILFIVFYSRFSSNLRLWYNKFGLLAVIADVLIIFIGIIIARFVYPYVFGEKFSLIKFIGLAVAIQITHDILFYYMFKLVPRGRNMMLDTFKDYANEVGFKAVLSDSLMMISACVLSSYFVSLNLNSNIIILILSVYILPYAIYN